MVTQIQIDYYYFIINQNQIDFNYCQIQTNYYLDFNQSQINCYFKLNFFYYYSIQNLKNRFQNHHLNFIKVYYQNLQNFDYFF